MILGNTKCCEHPETWAVRGLLLLGLGKAQEAEESVRRGLKNNLRSGMPTLCVCTLRLVRI